MKTLNDKIIESLESLKVFVKDKDCGICYNLETILLNQGFQNHSLAYMIVSKYCVGWNTLKDDTVNPLHGFENYKIREWEGVNKELRHSLIDHIVNLLKVEKSFEGEEWVDELF